MNKITHLIPATEFIGRYDIPGTETPEDLQVFANEIYNYAQFLKQPLQEWMVVGEDRLFEGFYEDYIKLFGSEMAYTPLKSRPKVEYLVNVGPLLTQKALDQIYGSI